jgi:hypothetical protein
VHVELFLEGAVPQTVVGSLDRWIFEVEILVDMPGWPLASATKEDGSLTLPSAQSIIWFRGSLALYIAVVLHHTGSPRNRTIAQKEKMTRLRMRKLSALSRGGSFFLGAAETAFSGAASSFSMPVPGFPLVEALMASSCKRSAMKLYHLEVEAVDDIFGHARSRRGISRTYTVAKW